jgi:tripartite-type tricarboxylate transporter receptor subunit TctC
MIRPLRRRLLIGPLLATLLAAGSSAIYAQGAFPTKPLKIVVPFAAGGVNDLLARMLAPKLSEAMGQPVVVENRSGAGGALGAAAVSRAEPDGYTILLHSNTVAIQPSLMKNPGYDVRKDLEPVTQLVSGPYTLVVGPSVPARTFPEFLAYARGKGSEIFYGSAGPGSSPHLVGELFNSVAGTHMKHVPYKGNGPMMAGIIAGEIQVGFDTIPNSRSLAEGGKIRVLALTSKERNAGMQDIPTIAESGVRDFDVSFWQALFLPRGTPQPIVLKWQAATKRVLQESPDVQKRMAELGFKVVASSPTELRNLVEADLLRWSKVIKEAGIQPE